MDFKKILHGILGKNEPEQKVKRTKWASEGRKSELSKRVKSGHKGTSGKRYEY